MSVILILTNGIICHHQAITMVFLGGKLVIIGGHLSYTKKRTNKVSVFDEDGQTWTSYYPDLLSVRSKPGADGHLKHVVAGDSGGVRPTSEDDDVHQ